METFVIYVGMGEIFTDFPTGSKQIACVKNGKKHMLFVYSLLGNL